MAEYYIPQPNDKAAYRALYHFSSSGEERLINNDLKLAHYTSAENALNIIQSKSIWLRNAAVMNDYSELEYGKTIIAEVMWNDGAAKKLKDAFNKVSEGWGNELERRRQFAPVVDREDVFLASLAEHDPTEQYGKLSMWRAYGGRQGGVALIFQPSILRDVGGDLRLVGSPVAYVDQQGFANRIEELAENIERHVEVLRRCEIQGFASNVFSEVQNAMTLTLKHPGFSEEKEWRLHHGFAGNIRNIKPIVVAVRGVPQIIQKYQFANVGDEIHTATDFATTLDSVLIGPCDHPQTVKAALANALTNAGVANANDRIVVSDIPLRQTT